MFTFKQEILLFTNNTFSQRQCCEEGMAIGSKRSSKLQQLESACWNGLLYKLLPEIAERYPYGRRLFLWQIEQGKSSLHFHFVALPIQSHCRSSTDPYFFQVSMLSNN